MSEMSSCVARLPVSNEELQTRESMESALRATLHALVALESDLDVFEREYPFANSAIEILFVKGASHKIHILLKPLLQKLKLLAENDSLLATVLSRLADVEETLETIILQKGMEHVSVGETVPTKSTRELMYRLLLLQPAFTEHVEKLEIGEKLLCIKKFLYRTTYPDTTKVSLEKLQKSGDGIPRMFFVCFHERKSDNTFEFVIGASTEEWNGLPSVAKIRREDRDSEIAGYQQDAERALTRLHELEIEKTGRLDTEGLTTKAIKCKGREEAIAAMRGEEAFLGRSFESGLAISRDLHNSKCCFGCRGMMGYIIPKKFSKKDMENYMEHWNWDLRAGFAHACAEIAVSKQCSERHVSEGYPHNA